MWGQQYGGGGGGGFGWQPQQWPGMAHQNPTPQSTDPVEWAAKAAQWAQQRQVQDHSYYQQTMLDQQQQLQLMPQQVHMHQQHGQYQGQTFSHGQTWSQQAAQQTVETIQPPKPLFDTLPVQQTHSSQMGGSPSNHPSFHIPPHSSAGLEDRSVREFRQTPPERFPPPGGPRGFAPRGRGERFHSPRGLGGPVTPRFTPRGSPPFHHHQHPEVVRSPCSELSGHQSGPTAEHFDRGAELKGHESNLEGSFPLLGREQGKSPRHSEPLEVVKQAVERERERERMRELERQIKIEMEKKEAEKRESEKREKEKEEQRKRDEAEAERVKQEQKRRQEEEEAAKRETEELEKKRQLDMQLAQEIENKKREMERILEQKERMERELMEKQAELGRIGGEGWDNYQSEQGFVGQQGETVDRPTIPSWSGDSSSIPALGELDGGPGQPTEREGGKQQSGNYQDQSQGQPKNEESSQMVESLGKIVSQLQTLQGLTSSLKLLQTMPKEGGRASEGGRSLSEREKAVMREKELSEDTKRKVAALLANDSDSDGEKDASSRREAESSTAREFDGTYSIQPQVYGTYQADDYGDDRRDDPTDMYKRDEGGGSRYSKYDYDEPRGEGREGRGSYGGFAPRDEVLREGDHRYPPRHYPTRRPPETDSGYPHPTPREYSGYSGGSWTREEEGRRRPPSPPPQRGPPRDYPHDRAPYLDPETPVPPAIRGRPLPDNYRGLPPTDPHYHRPAFPAEPKRSAGIMSQMESIDYSHGGGSSVPGIQSVDYYHGTPGSGGGGGGGFVPRETPPTRPSFPSFGGPGLEYSGIYGEASGFMGYGSAAMGAGGGAFVGAAGALDSAAIFAAYQGGEAKRRTLPLWLREELEKLERKKAKQLEKEAREGASGGEGGRPKWAKELEREGVGREMVGEGRWLLEEEEEEEVKMVTEKTRIYRQRSPSPLQSGDESPPHQKKVHYEPPPESEEDKHLHLVMKIRQMLTEVLLEVTNQEIESVASESIEEANKPKLVIQMKGLAANVPNKENRQLLGLGVYSSGSESETEDSPDKPHTSSRGGGRESRSKSKAVAEKMPKPEEIAAAFKDTKAGGGEGEGFMPVPRSVQEKHRETVRTSSTSSSSSKEKDRAKKSKEKYTLCDSGGHESTSREERKVRKKSSDKDRELDRESSGSSRKKSSSRGKEEKERRERERHGSKEHGSSREFSKHDSSKHSPSGSKSSKPRWTTAATSSTTPTSSTPTSSNTRSVRSRGQRSHSQSPPGILGGRQRSRSPPRYPQSPPPPQRVVEMVSSPPLGGVPTGKGSICTTRGGFVSTFRQGCAPIGGQEVPRRSPSPFGGMRSDDPSYREYSRRNSSQSSRY